MNLTERSQLIKVQVHCLTSQSIRLGACYPMGGTSSNSFDSACSLLVGFVDKGRSFAHA